MKMEVKYVKKLIRIFKNQNFFYSSGYFKYASISNTYFKYATKNTCKRILACARPLLTLSSANCRPLFKKTFKERQTKTLKFAQLSIQKLSHLKFSQ